MRILVVEDDAALRDQICEALRGEGYVAEAAADGEQGLYMAQEYPIDLAIVDLGLPKVTGIDLIKRLRKGTGSSTGPRSVPVLILTARDGWQNKVEGLEAGADDYLVKPFQTQELLARARALLRRAGGWASAKLVSGQIELDTTAKSLKVGERAVDLTSYEYRVLEYLLTNAGKVISKSELSEHLYAEEDERDSNVIEVFIRRLRLKIDPEATMNPITTLRGSGYRWDLPRA